jgi:hypothetical protein
MNKDYIPSAFPTYENNGKWLDISSEGMTLRDYFAAKFAASMIDSKWVDESSLNRNAEIAYKQADAMMKARIN